MPDEPDRPAARSADPAAPVDGQLGNAPTTPAPAGDLGSAPTTPAPEGTLAAGSNPDSTLDMPPGEQAGGAENLIGHFRVVRRLGMGGMGVVFACVDANLGRQVAVKLVREENPAYRARLLREAQAMARLEHPNVVRIYEVGTDRGRMFIAMELVDGETLASWLRSFRTWQDVVEMFAQVGAGLAAVHGAGLVHRDFKPDNVLVDRRGRARVADFGLARVDSEGDASPLAQPLTKSGVVMGTPAYMAPEQQYGSDVDARADQYSFCLALREALGGRPLDEQRWKQVPESIRIVVNRGLSYDPSERYPSMKELLRMLGVAQAPAPETDVVRPLPQTATPAREPRWAIALLVLAVLGIVAGVVAFVGTRKPASHAVAAPRDASPPLAQQPPADAMAQLAQVPADAMAELAHAEPTESVQAPAGHVAISTSRPHADAGIPTTHAPADASVPQIAASQTPPAPAAPGQLPTMSSSPAWGPYSAAWQNAPTGKLDVIRAAVKNVGFDGLGATSKADAEATLKATPDGPDRAIAHAQLGILARKNGDCAGAKPSLEAAIGNLPMWEPKDQALWRARAGLNKTLCTLAAGKVADALEQVLLAGNALPGEIQLVRGIIAFEQGDRPLAYGHLITAMKQGNATVKDAVKTYLDGYGLSLGP